MTEKEQGLISGLKELKDIQTTACWLSQQGWAEGGSGNISIRLEHMKGMDMGTDESRLREMPFMAPGLGGTFFLISASGSRMRDMCADATEHMCLIRVESGGKYYSILEGEKEISSEAAPHLLTHSMLMTERPRDRVILHTQPPHIIALTHIPGLTKVDGRTERLIESIFRMHPETKVHLPDKAGFVPFLVPGSVELGQVTAVTLKKHGIAIWEKHGVVATGADIAKALDKVELLEKAAEIYWKVLAMGLEPSGLSDEELQEARFASHQQ